MVFFKKNGFLNFFFDITFSKVRQNTFSDKIVGKKGAFFFRRFFPKKTVFPVIFAT